MNDNEQYNLLITYKNGSRKEKIIMLKEFLQEIETSKWNDIKDIKLERKIKNENCYHYRCVKWNGR